MPNPFNATFSPVHLTIRHVSLMRDETPLLVGLNFEVRSGQALVITGHNGVGKSTLLRAVAGLFPVQVGSIHIQSSEGSQTEDLLPGLVCHHMGHQDALRGALTLAEGLSFWRDMLTFETLGLPIADALDKVGLARLAHVPASALSAGQKRRAALARLLVAARPIWLLDEPLTALDAQGQALMVDLVQQHLALGGIVVAATHAPIALTPSRELRLAASA